MSSTVAEAAREVLAGGLVVLPTDTVYGIGCLPFHGRAVDRLFAAKERPKDLELPVLVPSREAAERVAVLDDRARALADRFWPGALTLVLPRSDGSKGWSLGGNDATVGVRVPDAAQALELLSVTGPLAVTSANRSGDPTLGTCEEIRALFGATVSVYLCADEAVAGRASSVLDLTGSEPKILRVGELADEVLAAL